jgi:hypothetical protein
MFNAPAHMTWTEAGLIMLLLLAGGFTVSWLTTDVLHVARQRYIAVLAAVTALLTAAVVWLARTPIADLLGHRWTWGLLGGVITGAFVGFGIRRMPARLHRAGRDLHEAEAWEGVVYGISEGLLLSGLPAFVAWQAADDADWSIAAAWGAALAASAVMIAIHHFGYWDYRTPLVFEAIAGCLVLTIAYLATGSILAPVLGHIIMHIAGITKGVELPPHPRLAATGRGRTVEQQGFRSHSFGLR